MKEIDLSTEEIEYEEDIVTVEVGTLTPEGFWSLLLDYSNTYSKVSINIAEFNKILKLSSSNLEDYLPVTDRFILKSGLYGYVKNMPIYCSKMVKAGTIDLELFNPNSI